ncbi:MAG: glyceraldehyde 3-phosphate dehydrogenase NAD-binding domain-containing protein [Pseudonocardiaceae bacterium]
MRVGINGMGRIGRAVLRHLWLDGIDSVIHVNDPQPTAENLAYLVKYDSVYGRFPGDVEVNSDGLLLGDSSRQWLVSVSHDASITDVDWVAVAADVVIEASGVDANARSGRAVVAAGVPYVVITQASPYAEATVVFGANEEALTGATRIFATNTCDAVAIAPVLRALLAAGPVESVFLVTLHPWLSYQNLSDGPVQWVAESLPSFGDMALGRASVGAIIPKTTTAARCVESVLPRLTGRITGMSYRVPTPVVCYCHLVVRFTADVTLDLVRQHLHASSPHLRISGEPVVSVDLIGEMASAVIDSRFIEQVGDRSIRLSLGYDNEWGFAARVRDLVAHLRKRLEDAVQ